MTDPEIERVRAVLESRFGLGGAETSERIGAYVVLDRLGAGRTGVVHRAYHRATDRTLTMKVVHAEVDSLALRDRLRARMRIELRGIVPVIDVGVDARTYAVMPYAPGRTLRQWCADAPRSWRRIVAAWAQVACVLADAHDVGLAHGDMKADHAIIDDAGRIAIVDFGGDGDTAGDQLALCTALFDALVGEDGVAEHGDRAVDLPPALHRVIARGLAVDPAARWPSMRALARALESRVSR